MIWVFLSLQAGYKDLGIVIERTFNRVIIGEMYQGGAVQNQGKLSTKDGPYRIKVSYVPRRGRTESR